MLKFIIDIVATLLLLDKWKFEWTFSKNPDLMELIAKAIEDGKLTNKEVGQILKQIEKEIS